MSKIKVKSQDFIKFIKYLGIKGDASNLDAVIDIDETCIKVLAFSQGKEIVLRGTLNGEFEKIGKVGISDVSILKKVLALFENKDNIELSIENNALKLNSEDGKIKASCILKSPDYIKNELDETTFNTVISGCKGNEFTFSVDEIKDMMKAFDIFDTDFLYFKGKGNEIKMRFASKNTENKIVKTITLADTVEDFDIKISHLLITVLSLFNLPVKLSVKGNSAVYIKVGEENYTFEYAVAQMIK